MRKLLPILLLAILFISCSSDDDEQTGDNGDPITIDEAILGKWKVEYSKTVVPALFDEETGEVTYENNAIIREYFGNWGEPNIVPESGMFDVKEIRIEVKNDNTIIVSIGGNNPKTITYKVEDGYLKQIHKNSTLTTDRLYYFEGDELVIEEMPNYYNFKYYTISRYSKIAE